MKNLEKKQQIIAMLNDGQSYDSIQKTLRVARKTISDVKKELTKAEDLVWIQSEVNEIKEKRKEKKAQQKVELLTDILKVKEDMLEDFTKLKNVACRPIEIKSTKSSKWREATAVLVASDWHIEENVDPSTINYLNEYNIDIAKKRANKFFEGSVKLVKQMQMNQTIKNIVFAMLGDMISGYIHRELEENNTLSPTQALIELRSIVVWWIKYLIDNTDCNIKVVCKFGNHGRTWEKIRISTGYKNSYEWMVYHFIAAEFEWNKRVEFIIENWYHTYVKIHNTMTRFHHWDSISYGGWVGWITIPINKAVAAWNESIRADLDVFGHFHQLTDNKRFVVNGSLIWYGAYAQRIKAPLERPQQAFFLIDEKYGKTVFAPILVD